MSISKIIKGLLNYFGFTITRSSYYINELNQKCNLLFNSSRSPISNLAMSDGINGFVYSYDRPLQLYLLLESYTKFVSSPGRITIIYKYSSNDMYLAYNEIENHFSKFDDFRISFVNENTCNCSFKETTLDLLYKNKSKWVYFLVDDDVFIKPFDLGEISMKLHGHNIFSLRHGLNVNYCYTSDINIGTPTYKLNDEFCIFDWFDRKGEWSDPWSLDGQIYSSSLVVNAISASDFSSPNTLEAELKNFSFCFKGKSFFSYKHQVLVNLVLNKVQKDYNNRCGEFDVNLLLKYWNDGLKIDLSQISQFSFNSTHVELSSLPLIKR